MATQPNISAQPSAQTLAARRFGYAQLTPENQQVADNVAAFMLLVQSIDKLPPERQQTALDMLGRGDVSGLAKEVWTVAGSGMTGLAGLVTRITGSAQAEVLGGTTAGRALSAIERMANGGSVPFMVLGLPADMLQSVRNRFQGEGIGVAGRLWGTTPLTNDAAREIGTAYASALQVRQEARGNTSFMQGLFSANFMTYLGAAMSYATQYVGWALNHVFGDKTATLRSLDSFVQEAMRPGDLPFVADSLKAAGTIAGVRMTDMLTQGLTRGGEFTTREGARVTAPAASDFRLDTTGRGQTPLPPAPVAAEQDPTRSRLSQIGEALSTPQGVLGAAGTVALGAAIDRKTGIISGPVLATGRAIAATPGAIVEAAQTIPGRGVSAWTGFASGFRYQADRMLNFMTAGFVKTDTLRAAEEAREAARAAGLSRREARDAAKFVFDARAAGTVETLSDVSRFGGMFKLGRILGRAVPVAGAGFVGLELMLPNPAYAREYDGRALSPMAMLDEDLKRGRITQAQHDMLRGIQLGNIGAGALGPLGTVATESALMVNGRMNPAYERYLSKPILDTLGELVTLPRVERTPEQQQFDRVYDALGMAPAAAAVAPASAPVVATPVAAAAPEVPADIRALMELRAKREALNDQAYGQGALTPGTTATGLPDWSRRDHARRELQRVEAEFEKRYDAIQQNPTLAAQLRSLTEPTPTQQAAPSTPATQPRVSDVRLPDSITGGVAADEADANRRPNAPFSMRSTTPPAMGAVLAN